MRRLVVPPVLPVTESFAAFTLDADFVPRGELEEALSGLDLERLVAALGFRAPPVADFLELALAAVVPLLTELEEALPPEMLFRCPVDDLRPPLAALRALAVVGDWVFDLLRGEPDLDEDFLDFLEALATAETNSFLSIEL